MKFSRRWEQFGTSIFSVMSQKAAAANAINLAQGFPDFDGPPELKQAAIKAIENGHNQYSPSAGIPVLREKLAIRQEKRYGLTFDPEREVTIFSGATEALFCALGSLLEPQDEVICLEPFYDSYPAGAFSAHATLRGVPLLAPSWRLDTKAMEAAVNPRTRALLINSPHNPTGMMLNAQERQFLAQLAIENDLIVITDEVYEEIFFADAHVPLATVPGLRERTVTISSFSKTFSMTGWKVGFAFAPPELTKQLRSLHQFTVFCSASPLETAFVRALDLDDDYFQPFRAEYRERRDLLAAVLTDAGFKLESPAGSYFILANFAKHSDLPDLAFADELIARAGVATVPISPFFADQTKAARLQYLRFAFCKGKATLESAGERLQKVFN